VLAKRPHASRYRPLETSLRSASRVVSQNPTTPARHRPSFVWTSTSRPITGSVVSSYSVGGIARQRYHPHANARASLGASQCTRIAGCLKRIAILTRICSALQEMQRKDELSFATMVNPRHNRARRRSPAPSAPEMVDEEIAFDPDIHKSHLGRLVKVRESTNHTWQHGVPCFAVTEWELEDYHGDGKMCKVEKPTGGYQLQWGLFERIEQAMSQKRSAKTVRVAFCVVRFRARPPAGRLDAAP